MENQSEEPFIKITPLKDKEGLVGNQIQVSDMSAIDALQHLGYAAMDIAEKYDFTPNDFADGLDRLSKAYASEYVNRILKTQSKHNPHVHIMQADLKPGDNVSDIVDEFINDVIDEELK